MSHRVIFDECGLRAHLLDDEYGDGSAWCQACGSFQTYEAYPAARKDYARWAASHEPLHAIRWRWRYWIKFRLIGRKGPL